MSEDVIIFYEPRYDRKGRKLQAIKEAYSYVDLKIIQKESKIIDYIEFCTPNFGKYIQFINWERVNSYGFNRLIDDHHADEVKDWLELTYPKITLRT